MRKDALARQLIISQAILYATLLICILLAPASLGANSGLSYFGHHRLTAAPFALGILLCDYFLFQVYKLLNNKLRPLKVGLEVIIPCMVGVVVAPALGSGLLDLLHRAFGSLIFISELYVGCWVAFLYKKSISNQLLWLTQLAGGVIAFIYLSPPQGFSIQGQLLFQLAFSTLILKNFAFSEE